MGSLVEARNRLSATPGKAVNGENISPYAAEAPNTMMRLPATVSVAIRRRPDTYCRVPGSVPLVKASPEFALVQQWGNDGFQIGLGHAQYAFECTEQTGCYQRGKKNTLDN